MTQKLTPTLQHYLQLKEEHSDRLLFYQIGDFFELYFDDAIRGAELLNITLTARNKDSPKPIPMAGVPVQMIETHVAKLLKAGVAAVICEQIGTNEKGIIERQVTRIITAGTATEDALLTADKDNVILCIYQTPQAVFLASADLSSAWFRLSSPLSLEVLAAEIERLKPAEILMLENMELVCEPKPQRLPYWHFDITSAYKTLCEYYEVAHLDAFGLTATNPAISAAGALLQYLSDLRINIKLPPPQIENPHDFLIIDAATRRHLEIEYATNGNINNSLFAKINFCQSALGQRLLRRWLNQPLCDVEKITTRHNAVTAFLQSDRSELRRVLREIADVERITTRIKSGSARVRELLALRETLQILPLWREWLPQSISAPDFLPFSPLVELLSTLNSEIGGQIFYTGFDAELDELNRFHNDIDGVLKELEEREREKIGLKNFKINYNQIQGFYIEISRNYTGDVPEHWTRRQTLKNVERYTTRELTNLESRYLHSQSAAAARERWLFQNMLQNAAVFSDDLYRLGAQLAEIDVLSSFAELAQSRNYCRPEFTTETSLKITAGRHPVLDANHLKPFIPNDLNLHERQRLLIITGANMGGKSTYMRQSALIVLMAQVGSFVPADAVKMSVFEQIFSRIGASDDLFNARSTFMVEMTETAHILHHANKKSLVIIDEIGRGTSTFDGLSLAWATANSLLNVNQALTLFATHYFELTEIGARQNAANIHLKAVEYQDNIVFIHKVQNGAASRSYGIQVARLAGMPKDVIHQATLKLRQLEAQRIQSVQNNLFTLTNHDEITNAIRALNLDETTPRQAWDLLQLWQEKLK